MLDTLTWGIWGKTLQLLGWEIPHLIQHCQRCSEYTTWWIRVFPLVPWSLSNLQKFWIHQHSLQRHNFWLWLRNLVHLQAMVIICNLYRTLTMFYVVILEVGSILIWKITMLNPVSQVMQISKLGMTLHIVDKILNWYIFLAEFSLLWTLTILLTSDPAIWSSYHLHCVQLHLDRFNPRKSFWQNLMLFLL